MTTKDKHVLTFWYNLLADEQNEKGRGVSAGEVARRAGMNVGTSKKYLNRLVGEGVATKHAVVFTNKTDGYIYEVV